MVKNAIIIKGMNTTNNILYKGIFWFKDLDNIFNNDTYYRLPCDEKGNVKENNYNKDVFGKIGNNFNHKKFWDTLLSNVTNNKSFDYYPRGRVEIKNGKATIFITQDLVSYQKDVILFIKDKFNLTNENGITKIDVKFDGSSHYKSKLGEI